MKRRLAALLLLSAGAYALSGVYFVQPDEQAVVRRFGALAGTPREPGANLGLPWGLDRVDRLKPREIKRLAIGPPTSAQAGVGAAHWQFLTGDRNLVNVRATVQYTVTEPADYLFHAAGADRLIACAAEAALSEILATEPVDRALTQGKRDLGVRAADKLQALLADYRLGVSVRSVDIGAVEPPPDVADAFDKVTAALRQREQAINQAHSFANRARAEAAGAAQQALDEAHGYRDRLIRQAEGEAARFERLLSEYRRAPELTSRRLYLETMAAALPRFRSKLIVDSGAELDLSILGEQKP